MRLDLADLRGVHLYPSERHTDRRGNFVKLRDTAERPLEVDQICTSFNHRAGTLRGLHIQLPPHVEEKFVWCTAGAIWDVLVDARPGEPTYGRWAAAHLQGDDPRLLRVPPGVAHGYQTLTDGATVAYLIKGPWVPSAARTIAWDDPTLSIDWPRTVTEISDTDADGASWPLS